MTNAGVMSAGVMKVFVRRCRRFGYRWKVVLDGYGGLPVRVSYGWRWSRASATRAAGSVIRREQLAPTWTRVA